MKINKKKSFGTLLEGLKSTTVKKHYVSSAIFPVIISNQNDLNIVFLNYWKRKNKINEKNLRIYTKIYDTEGNLVCHHGQKISKLHNQLSIKDVLKKYNNRVMDFVGSVNVEILSLETISYPFPAITAIYNSNNIYSAIHSAGRLKNNVEPQEVMYTEESYWTCKFEKSITPFFHYFVGNQTPYEKYITVKLIDKNNKVKNKKKILIDNINPFGSKIFYIKELFKKNNFSNSDFVSVKVEHNSIFPRMIVGNYHKKKKFYEVTHSSPIMKKNHYIKNGKFPYMSRIPLSKNKDLNLQLKIFPTFSKGNFEGDIYVKKINDNNLKKTNEIFNFSKKTLPKLNTFDLNEDEELKSIKLKGNNVPERLYTCNFYTVKNVKSQYSLDIAETSFASYFPKKFTHWGHGYIGEGFDTVIMVINDDCENISPIQTQGTLNIYSKNFHEKVKVKIKGGSLLSLNLSKIKELKKLRQKNRQFISWELKLKKPGCETRWISYRKKDGSIFGDHGF